MKAINSIVEEDILFKEVGGRRLEMDFHLPQQRAEGKLPWVVYWHGGSWKNGSRKDVSHFRSLVDHGIAVFSCSYSFAPQNVFPAQLIDCRDALSFILQNAKRFNIDPRRMGLIGSSSGGHLAGLTALSDGCAELGLEKLFDVKALCMLYSPADMYDLPKVLSYYEKEDWSKHFGAVRALMGGFYKDMPDTYRLGSPAYHVKSDSSPLLLLHGTGDMLVPYEHSLRMKERYDQQGASAELFSIENCNHSFVRKNPFKPIVPDIHTIYEKIANFFDGYLKK